MTAGRGRFQPLGFLFLVEGWPTLNGWWFQILFGHLPGEMIQYENIVGWVENHQLVNVSLMCQYGRMVVDM